LRSATRMRFFEDLLLATGDQTRSTANKNPTLLQGTPLLQCLCHCTHA